MVLQRSKCNWSAECMPSCGDWQYLAIIKRLLKLPPGISGSITGCSVCLYSIAKGGKVVQLMQICTVDAVYTFHNLNFRRRVQPSIGVHYPISVSVFSCKPHWMITPSIHEGTSIHKGIHSMQFHLRRGMERRMSTGTPNGCRKLSSVVPGEPEMTSPKMSLTFLNCLLMMLHVRNHRNTYK